MQTTARQENTEMGRQNKPHHLLASTGTAPGMTQEWLQEHLAHRGCGWPGAGLWFSPKCWLPPAQEHRDIHHQATDRAAWLGLGMHTHKNKNTATRFTYLDRKRVADTDVCEKTNALIHLSRTTVQIISLDTLILIHNLQCYGPYTNYCCSQQQMNINITVPSIIARGSN